MTPSCYVSCGSHELPRAVVCDWTEDVARHGSAAHGLDWRERARISPR